MKKIYKGIAHCDLLIAENKRAIKTAPKLPYYKLHAHDGELEQDINEFQQCIKDQLSLKFRLLEKLETKIKFIKMKISSEEREITLEKNQTPSNHE